MIKAAILSALLLGGSTQAPTRPPIQPVTVKQVPPTVIVWIWVPRVGPVPILK